MSESTMRQGLCRNLRKAGLDARAIENSTEKGTPDVNYLNGWLELKWLRSWPKRESTNVAISHYTKEQRIWHLRRWNAGGLVFLVLQVQREWLIFRGCDASRYVGSIPRAELYELAIRRYPNGVKWADFAEWLRMQQPPLRGPDT